MEARNIFYSEDDSIQQNVNIDLEFFTDTGVWNIPLPDAIRLELVLLGPNNLQNKEGPFKSKEKSGANPKGEIRTLNKDWFYRKFENGERDHGCCTLSLYRMSLLFLL